MTQDYYAVLGVGRGSFLEPLGISGRLERRGAAEATSDGP